MGSNPATPTIALIEIVAFSSIGRASTYTATLVIGQEAAGAGTGVLCFWNGSKWEIVGTTMAPSA